MKTLFYYIPPTVALLFYALLVLTSGLGSIHLMAWFFVILLFVLIDLTQQVTISCNSPKYRTASMR